MTIERAIEILDPEHREHYESIEPVNEACRMGMNALKELSELKDKLESGKLVEIDESLIGQEIIGIHHFTDGTYQLDLDENIVIGFSSCGVITWNATHCYNDRFENDMFFIDNEKGKAKAESRLKELREKQNDE